MTWVPVESTDVVAIGWEQIGEEEGSDTGMMGIQFHRPPGSTYLYYDVPLDVYQEFMSAPSKGQYVNRVLRAMGLVYEKVA